MSRYMSYFPLPVGMGVVVHEPGAIVVHIHGPGLIILPQHYVFQHVTSGDPKCRVRVIVIAIYGHFPVMHTTGEGRVAHDNTVVVTITCDCEVVIRQYDVWMC